MDPFWGGQMLENTMKTNVLIILPSQRSPFWGQFLDTPFQEILGNFRGFQEILGFPGAGNLAIGSKS